MTYLFVCGADVGLSGHQERTSRETRTEINDTNSFRCVLRKSHVMVRRIDQRAVFIDLRVESHVLPDISSAGGSRTLVISPDIQADFTRLPFKSDHFYQVVFDPPHFQRNGSRSWVGLKYGTLSDDWQDMIRSGFAECFRVLVPGGTLVFKWCEDEIPVSRILALAPERPLFGNKSGKNSKTHWLSFLKPAARRREINA